MTLIESRPQIDPVLFDTVPSAVVALRDVRKTYGTFEAVRGVSLNISRGEIFGVLGPNGAGKTTTLEMAVGLRTPTSGTAQVLGYDPHRNRAELARSIGVQPQDASLFPTLRVRETLELFASFYPYPLAVDTLLEMVDLTAKAKSAVKNLSGGQRQRLLIALALVGDPQIIFLDEPSGPLDPQARRQLWAVIEDFRADGRTVVLTTHAMEEAAALCDRIAIMDRGQIIALDTPSELVRHHVPTKTIRFETAQPVNKRDFEMLPGVTTVRVIAHDEGSHVELVTADTDGLLRQVVCGGVTGEWRNVVIANGTLEDVFLTLTGRPIRD